MSLRMEAGFGHLKDAMAEVLSEEVEFVRGALVTVMGAKMTADTAHAKIILSVFPESLEEEVVRSLKEFEPEIKEALSKKLRLRRIPELYYEFDHTEATAAGVEDKLKELREKGEI